MFNASNSNAIISKSKSIFWNFFCISKIHIKSRLLWNRRWASEIISFSNYRLQKFGLLKCLKKPVSQHLWTINMLKCPKDCLNLHDSLLSNFLITLKGNQEQKFCFSCIWNLETVSQHIDTRWQVFSLSKREFLMKPIQMLSSRNQNSFFPFLFFIFHNLHKFGILWKKRWASQ